jgi:hypothetical protein
MVNEPTKEPENKGVQIDYEKLAIHLAPLLKKENNNAETQDSNSDNNKNTNFLEKFKAEEEAKRQQKEHKDIILNAYSDIYAGFNEHVKNADLYNQIKDLEVGKKANLLAKELIEKAFGVDDTTKNMLKSFDEQSVFDKGSGFYIKYLDAINMLSEKKNDFYVKSSKTHNVNPQTLSSIVQKLFNTDTKDEALKQAKELSLI